VPHERAENFLVTPITMLGQALNLAWKLNNENIAPATKGKKGSRR